MSIFVTHSSTPLSRPSALRQIISDGTFQFAFFPDFNTTISDTEFYALLPESSLHVVFNEDAIGRAEANHIMAAMLKNKTIILMEPPRFKEGVSQFSRTLITSRLNKIIVANILILDASDLKNLLAATLDINTNYVLTKHERILIKSSVNKQIRQNS